LEVWRDTEDIGPATEWRDEISEGIANAEAVLVVVSPDSMASEEVGKEITGAEEWGKLIVPVLHRELDGVPAHPDVAKRNFVFWRTDDEAQTALEKIDVALKVDPDWAKLHTRINKGAVGWQDRERDRSRLLRGSELEEAELAIGVSRPPEQPQATNLMHQFVAEGRRVASRRQRILVFTSLGVAAVSITLAIVAVFFQREAATQRDEARRQRDTATAAALAAESENTFAAEPDLAALLALEAFRTKDTVEARGSLLDIADEPTTFVERAEEHEGSILAMARHETDALVASGDDDGRVVVWDVAEDGRPAARTSIETGAAVTALRFADGPELLIATAEGVQRREVSADGVAQIANTPIPTEVLAFSDDGMFGASFDRDGDGSLLLVIYRIEDGAVLTSPPLDIGYDDYVESLDGQLPPFEFSGDGGRVATAVGDEILVWTPLTGSVDLYPVSELGIAGAERLVLDVSSLSFIGEGDRLAFGTEEGGIYLLDLAGEETAEAEQEEAEPPAQEPNFLEALNSLGPPAVVGEALFPPSSSRVWALDAAEVDLDDGFTQTVVASAHNNGEVKIWFVDELDGFEAASLRGHDEEVRAVLLSDAGLVLSGSFDGDIITSSIDPLAAIGERFVDPAVGASHAFDVADVVYAGPDVVASLSGDDGELKLWDAATLTLEDQSEGVTSIDAANDVVVLGDGSGQVVWLEVPSGTETAFEPTHDGEVVGLAVSSDGQRLASTDGESVWLWDALGERLAIADLPGDFAAQSFAFAGSDRLWVGGALEDDNVAAAVLVDAATGAALERIGHNADEEGHVITSLAVSPAGDTLVTGGSDRRIFVWDTADLAAEPAELAGHLDAVTSIVFFDDTTIIASDSDGRILLWDLVAGRVVGDLTGPSDGVNALALHPQRTAIVAASEDDLVWSWDLRDEMWVEAACELAGRNFSDSEWEQFQLDGEPVRHCADFEPDERQMAVYPTDEVG
ncbi:MAG: TIR domain-containing protein, partial [Acidimicrobiia bacterium]|nr:TIR domain-containing protein [Acidimicrobiia bacterium]